MKAGGSRLELSSGILAFKGDYNGALQAIRQESDEQSRLYGLVPVYHAMGQTTKADSALNEYIEIFPVSQLGSRCLLPKAFFLNLAMPTNYHEAFAMMPQNTAWSGRAQSFSVGFFYANSLNQCCILGHIS